MMFSAGGEEPSAAEPLLKGGRANSHPNVEEQASRTLTDTFHSMVILIGTGFILVYLADVIVPLVVAMLFVYLFRPLTDWVERTMSKEGFRECKKGRCCRCFCRCCCCCAKAPGEGEEAEVDEEVETHVDDENIDVEEEKNAGKEDDDEERIHRATESGTSLGDRLRRRWSSSSFNFPRLLGVFVSLTLALIVLSGAVLIIASSITNIQDSGKLDTYETQYHKLENKAIHWISKTFHVDGEDLFKSFRRSDVLTKLAGTTMAGVANFTASTFLVLAFLAFLLVTDSADSRHGQKGSLHDEVNDGITQYLLLKTKICGLASLLVWIILALLRIPLASLFALLAFVLNFVPNIGPIISTWLPLPVVVLDPHLSGTQIVLSIVLPGLVPYEGDLSVFKTGV